MPWCYPCDRYFNTEHALDQHVQNSKAHYDEDWECDYCDRSFGSERSLDQHMANSYGHPYCSDCNRKFQNDNNLQAHLRSRIHQGNNMKCPFCPNSYPTVSAMTIHLESGSCKSGLNRQKINNIIRGLDRNNVITERLITYPGQWESNGDTIATEAAWNGDFYECYFCNRQFRLLRALNQHLSSGAHDQDNYHCPKCARKYRLLSGLVQHVESESCGIMKFRTMQKAGNDLHNLAQRLLTAR